MGNSYYIGCLKHKECLNMGKNISPFMDEWGNFEKDFIKEYENSKNQNNGYTLKQIEDIKIFLEIHKTCDLIADLDNNRGSEDFKFYDCEEYSIDGW